MMFSELYGAYYNTVAKIISAAAAGKLDKKEMQRIVRENAFSESVAEICPALMSGDWQLVSPDYTTPVKNPPSMPMTLLQKRWLKAILCDKRIKLFDLKVEGLDDVLPLFTPQDYVVFDQYSDGDDYENEDYIRHFRLICRAIREKFPLEMNVVNRRGSKTLMRLMPEYLEYSEKDDKFRLFAKGCRYGGTVNLSRIITCKRFSGRIDNCISAPKRKEKLVLELLDERNTLERVMLHFAHFEKQAEKISEGKYRLLLIYDASDETELLIRVLSFGPTVKVISPDHFIDQLRDRLAKQHALFWAE